MRAAGRVACGLLLSLGAWNCTGQTGDEPDGGSPDGGPAWRDAGTTDSDAGTADSDAGHFPTLPWEGGAAYYARWPNGPSADPFFFPIAVWLQSPARAAEYASIGVNLFIALWEGPTEAQLSGLAQAQVPAICAQEGVWADHLDGGPIQGWMHEDEPDNAQPAAGGGWGPCVAPQVLQQGYQAMKANDASRPVYANFGPGVADHDWGGRGPCTGRVDMYPDYAQAADILSFDIYPVNASSRPEVQGHLEYVAKGVDTLRAAAGYQKPVWVWIETTDYDGKGNVPTVAQVEAEVWMALIHGARGIGYFAHIFAPTFIEAGLLSSPTMKAGVSAINAQVKALAPVLNQPSLDGAVRVTSSQPAVPIDLMVKRHEGVLYLFAVSMAAAPTVATFEVLAPVGHEAQVLGEGRSVTLSDGGFSDAFDGYAVHRYRLE